MYELVRFAHRLEPKHEASRFDSWEDSSIRNTKRKDCLAPGISDAEHGFEMACTYVWLCADEFGFFTSSLLVVWHKFMGGEFFAHRASIDGGSSEIGNKSGMYQSLPLDVIST